MCKALFLNISGLCRALRSSPEAEQPPPQQAPTERSLSPMCQGTPDSIQSQGTGYECAVMDGPTTDTGLALIQVRLRGPFVMVVTYLVA